MAYRRHAGPPQTAEEYLQWVRHEAMQCPQVFTAEISPEKLARLSGQADAAGRDRLGYVAFMSQSRSLEQAPTWAEPSASWVRDFLLDFRQLRLQLVELAAEHEDGEAISGVDAIPPHHRTCAFRTLSSKASSILGFGSMELALLWRRRCDAATACRDGHRARSGCP